VAADGEGLSLHYLDGGPDQPGAWFSHTADPGAAPADADGDGQGDTDEWLAGTNPGDAGSSFQMSGVSLSPSGQFSASFPVAAGHRYRIERSGDLVEWEAAQAEFVAAADGMQIFTTPVVAGEPGFFRVVAVARP
jgi:hypothetical protein